jgi:hypothetical protein
MSVSQRRTRVQLTLEEKREICQLWSSFPSLTDKPSKERIQLYFEEKFNKAMSRVTISETLKNSEFYLAGIRPPKKAPADPNKYIRMEELLYKWCREFRARKELINQVMLEYTASHFYLKVYGNDTFPEDEGYFRFSKRWLQSFKERFLQAMQAIQRVQGFAALLPNRNALKDAYTFDEIKQLLLGLAISEKN